MDSCSRVEDPTGPWRGVARARGWRRELTSSSVSSAEPRIPLRRHVTVWRRGGRTRAVRIGGGGTPGVRASCPHAAAAGSYPRRRPPCRVPSKQNVHEKLQALDFAACRVE